MRGRISFTSISLCLFFAVCGAPMDRAMAKETDPMWVLYPGILAANGEAGFTPEYKTVNSAGQVWLDRNLGARGVADSPTDPNAYGYFYQWGRLNDGHQFTRSAIERVKSNSDVPGHSRFILGVSLEDDWRTPKNDNLWQGKSGINNPCPDGFRLPTSTELDVERTSWSSPTPAGAFASPLKHVMAGWREPVEGKILEEGLEGNIWSSTVSTNGESTFLEFNDRRIKIYDYGRATGFSVRCIQD